MKILIDNEWYNILMVEDNMITYGTGEFDRCIKPNPYSKTIEVKKIVPLKYKEIK